MQLISQAANPDSIVFVMDASIGQAAEGQAYAFKESVSIGNIILTKMDGAGKGGGALSAIAATGAPVSFIGTGEHIYDFEMFSPKGFIGKLLGMGDVSSLMDRVSDLSSKDKTLEMAKRIEQGIFTLKDLKDQIQMMLNMGPMSKVLGMLPGMGGMNDMFGSGKDEDISKKMKLFLTCMDSMTRDELDGDGKLLSEPSRIRRITRGSGCKDTVIFELLQHFKKFAQMIKKMSGNGGMLKNMMSGMSGGKVGGLSPQMMQQMTGGLDMNEMMASMNSNTALPKNRGRR